LLVEPEYRQRIVDALTISVRGGQCGSRGTEMVCRERLHRSDRFGKRS
jgi:hypothetical protein